MYRLLKKAFTLIELLVVIAIIGILSGLVIVGMNGMAQKATIAKSQVFSNSLRNSLMLNIVGEWKFDGTGKNDGDTADATYVQDIWAGNTGSISGNPLVRKGNKCVNGSCLEFNGNGDYISFTTVSSNARTQAGWFYFYQQASTAGTDKYLFNNLRQIPANNLLYSASADYFGWAPALNTWYYIIFTFPDKTNDVAAKLYINTVAYSLNQQSASHTILDVSTISYSSLNAFNGLIDEVRIYSNIIPTSQIKEQYYAGLNSLLANGQINAEEYSQRINSIAKE